MYLRIVDSVTNPAHPVNEDVWANTSTALWLLDGASSVSAPYYSDRSDARWMVDIASEQFGLLMANETDKPRIVMAVRRVANAINQEMSKKQPEPADLVRPSAAGFILEIIDNRLHYFSLGNVTFALTGSNSVVLEDDKGLQKELGWVSRAGNKTYAPTITDPAIAKEIKNNRRSLMNKPNGYWILSNSPEAADHGRVGRFKVSEGDYVMLASDGFARLITTFQAYESWQDVIDASLRTSLSSICHQLRDLEMSDSERKRFPRVSVHDDATAVIARIESAAP